MQGRACIVDGYAARHYEANTYPYPTRYWLIDTGDALLCRHRAGASGAQVRIANDDAAKVWGIVSRAKDALTGATHNTPPLYGTKTTSGGVELRAGPGVAHTGWSNAVIEDVLADWRDWLDGEPFVTAVIAPEVPLHDPTLSRALDRPRA